MFKLTYSKDMYCWISYEDMPYEKAVEKGAKILADNPNMFVVLQEVQNDQS